jgi:hypothetical protein
MCRTVVTLEPEGAGRWRDVVAAERRSKIIGVD